MVFPASEKQRYPYKSIFLAIEKPVETPDDLDKAAFYIWDASQIRSLAHLTNTSFLLDPSTNMGNEVISVDVDGTAEVRTDGSSDLAGSVVALRKLNQTNFSSETSPSLWTASIM